MNVIPAVDILDGKCVQLVGGDPQTAEFYGDPIQVAVNWKKLGAPILHVVDLNAALGKGENSFIIDEIRSAVDIPIELGGGIRTRQLADETLRRGIDRIIVGTIVLEDRENDYAILRELADHYGTLRIIVAIDAAEGKVAYKGWQEKTDLSPSQLAKRGRGLGLGFSFHKRRCGG